MDYQLHKPSTGHSVNPYTDKYTGFIWNEHHSSDFNCFIENTGHLTFEPAPEFSNSMVSPAFYDGSLFTGTQTQSKKVQLNLVFYHITLADFNRALKWLDYKKVGSLLFDYSDEWRYQCKLSSLGVTEKYVDGYCLNEDHGSYTKQDLYICRVQVVFETVDMHNAISAYGEVIREDCILLPYDAAVPSIQIHPISSGDYNITKPILNIKNKTIELTIGQTTYFAVSFDDGTRLNIQYFISPKNINILQIRQGYYISSVPEAGFIKIMSNSYLLSNTHSIPTSFRVHFFNVQTSQFVLYLGEEEDNRIPICSVDLNLDVGGVASLHYNSKSGAVTMGDKLINQVTNGNGDIVTKYCSSLSQITIPPYSEITLSISDNYIGDIMIDYDLQESVL